MEALELEHAMTAGPRGRRLCLEVACLLDDHFLWEVHRFDDDPMSDALADAVAAAFGRLDVTPLAAFAEATALIESFASAVDRAAYWQPPDDEDLFLARPAVVAALGRIARAIVDSPAALWWRERVALDAQQYVMWLDEPPAVPLRTIGAADGLAKWKVDALEREKRAPALRSKLTARFSGAWWSSPSPYCVTTTRSVPGLGAVELALEEDAVGWASARVSGVRIAPHARVYEIDGADAWVALAGRFPFEVTRSARHDWWRSTGATGTLLIPDWQAVATEYDGVHLSIVGYLATAGRALPVGDATTVLAGWDPDATYWLSDVLTATTEVADWNRSDDDVWIGAAAVA